MQSSPLPCYLIPLGPKYQLCDKNCVVELNNSTKSNVENSDEKLVYTLMLVSITKLYAIHKQIIFIFGYLMRS
jgi:hypothetical protein